MRRTSLRPAVGRTPLIPVNTLLNKLEEALREMIREEVSAFLSKTEARHLEKAEPVLDDHEYERLITAAEVAEMLGCPISRVYELARQRRANGFPVIVLGERHYRFSRKQIFAWLDRR